MDCLVEIDVSLVANGRVGLDVDWDDLLLFKEVGLELAADSDGAFTTEIVYDILLPLARLDKFMVFDSAILMTDLSSNGQRTL